MVKVEDFRIRDPFIVLEDDTYYMTGTDFVRGVINLYASRDLKEFSDPIPIFHTPADSWIDDSADFWAPEIHRYNGRFVLLFSPLGKEGKRGTVLAVSDTLTGEYRMLKNGPVTPEKQFCIDGTLYVENDTPYLVYSHDWPDCPMAKKNYFEGEICAVQLKDDLSDSVGEPFRLFGGATPSFAVENVVSPGDRFPEGAARFGTDGPFLRKTAGGKLLLLWSPMVGNTYVIAAAVSESGSVKGPWAHPNRFVFSENGGHTMLFRDREGRLRLSFHRPEEWGKERLNLRFVSDADDFFTVIS